MSLTENDPLEFLWKFHPVVVGVVVALFCMGILYLVEVGRYLADPTRLPWGLAIFRWNSNWLGELFLIPIAISFMAAYYQRVQVEPSFWTSPTFFILCWIVALIYVFVFVTLENTSADFPPGERLNANRIWHVLYSVPLMAIMVGGTRLIGYGLIGGRERGLAFGALAFTLLFLVIAVVEFNPILDYLASRYGRERAFRR